MPLFGAHMSAAGGVRNAVKQIMDVNGAALQVFTANQRQWTPRQPDASEVAAFREEVQRWGGGPIAAHASYLINMASAEAEMATKSVDALVREMERCAALGIGMVILHPGAHLGSGTAAGIRQAALNLDAVFDRIGQSGVDILLENTAGQGTCLGADMSELGAIIGASRHPDRLGVCIDTAHAFGAGYALDTEEGYKQCIDAVEAAVGLAKLRFFHVNDSAAPCGSRKDRHAHIGQGAIGVSGFARLVRDPRFAAHPMVLETPKGPDLAEDKMNLALLRELAQSR